MCVLTLKIFYFVITLVSVLKSVTKLFLKTLFEKVFGVKFFVCLSKYLGTNLPTRKKTVHFPLDNAITLLRNR